MESPQSKIVIALLKAEDRDDTELYKELESTFGPIDFKGHWEPFSGTSYYEDEFGESLHRRLIGFQKLDCPSKLSLWKNICAQLESNFSEKGKRIFNIDIGYLDNDKFVLASFKRGPFKLFIGNRVYADMTLGYKKGEFIPFKWTFLDFKTGLYHRDLKILREKLKAEMRRNRKNAS